MPKKINGKPVDEAKWAKAKAIAEKEGRAEDYAYITGIYEKMTGMKKSLFTTLVMRLEKGRKAVAIGTRRQIKGTKYWQERTATGWKAVKVDKKAKPDLTKTTSGTQNAPTNANTGSTSQTQPVAGKDGYSKDNAPPVTLFGKRIASLTTSSAPAKKRGRPAGYKKINGKFVNPTATQTTAPEPKKDAGTSVTNKKAADSKKIKDKKDKTPAKGKKEAKAKPADKNDKHQVGDRVMYKKKDGTYYWAVKQADGSMKYDGVAMPAEAKAYMKMLRKKTMADKQRANNAARIQEIKNGLDPTKVDPDWNADGTPKQSAFDKMPTKEKLYWTTASPRARAISDKSGILCMDKEAEDYIEAKLDTIFKPTTAQTTIIKEADPSTPLDTNAAFADDMVFMQDTLANMQEYYNDIQTREKDYKNLIQDRIEAELSSKDNAVRWAVGLRDDDKYKQYVNDKVYTEYMALLDAAAKWVNAIKDSETDAVVMTKMRTLDEELAATSGIKFIPVALTEALFSDEFSKMDSPVRKDDIPELYSTLTNLGISEEFIDTVLRHPNPAIAKNTIMTLLMNVLHPQFDLELAQELTEKGKAKFGGEHGFLNLYNKEITNSYGSVDVEPTPVSSEHKLTAQTLYDNAKKLQTKYASTCGALGTVTDIRKAGTGFDTFSAESSQYGFSLGSGSNYGVRLKSDTLLKDVRDRINSVKHTTYYKPNSTLDKVHSALTHLDGGIAIGLANDAAIDKLKNEYSNLSDSSRPYITLKDTQQSLGIRPDLNDGPVDVSGYNYIVHYRGTKFSAKQQRYYSYADRVDPMEYGKIQYSGWKPDSTYGGGTVEELGLEKLGETTNYKSSTRAKWNSTMTTLLTSAGTSAWNRKHEGAESHAAASLAVAIGLNWQVRKLTKAQKVIPEWKWFEGTKPFDKDNPIPVTARALVDHYSYTRGRTYQRTRTPVANDTLPEKYQFTPEKYRLKLEMVKNDSIASELGMLGKDTQRGKSGRVIPKIVLKTVDNIEDIRKELVDKWTHKDYDFQAKDFKVYHAFDIMYHDYYPKYKEMESKLGNVSITFSSTDFMAGASIIKGGFKFMRIRNGNMFGIKRRGQTTDRVYSTPSTSKTCQYLSKAFTHGGHGVMFRCRVALGKMNPTGADSSRAVRDSTYNTVFGQGDPSGHKKYGLDHDEYAVKDPKQMIPLQWIDVGRA